MKVFCSICNEHTDPKHQGDWIIMECSKCNTKYDFSETMKKVMEASQK